MEGFKKGPKVQCYKEGGQVGYKSRKEHSESKEMAEDVKQDKKIVKKAFSIHDKQQHEEKTDLSKLKKGGRAKKETGTVKKYCGGGKAKKYAEGGAIEAVKGVGKRLYENVMGTPEQNAAAQARLDKYTASKKSQIPAKTAERAQNMDLPEQSIPSDIANKASTMTLPETKIPADVARKASNLKRGGKCK